MSERRLSDDEEAYLGPVAMAIFIEAGWIKEWPKTTTRAGEKAIKNGFGVWTGVLQKLPHATEASRYGAAHWEGRRT